MEWTLTYVGSQVSTIIMYTLLASTYYLKDRNKILIVSFLSFSSIGIAYILLNAWTGFAMCVVAIIRNIIFIIDEKKNGKRENINKKDIVILIILYVISIISVFFTYDGLWSLLSVFATMLYTYSVWQKNTKVYKWLGVPVSLCWITYNIYISSLFGIILETVLMTSAIIGYLRERK